MTVRETDDNGEEILTVLQEGAAEPAADKVGDSTVDSFFSATEDALETEALQILTLTSSSTASTLPRPDRRPTCRFGEFVVDKELENLALYSVALALPDLPQTVEGAFGDPNWGRAMQRQYNSLMTNEVWALAQWQTASNR